MRKSDINPMEEKQKPEAKEESNMQSALTSLDDAIAQELGIDLNAPPTPEEEQENAAFMEAYRSNLRTLMFQMDRDVGPIAQHDTSSRNHVKSTEPRTAPKK